MIGGGYSDHRDQLVCSLIFIYEWFLYNNVYCLCFMIIRSIYTNGFSIQ